MPRKPRELEDNGIYHVFNRGNNKHDLFHDAEDFSFFYDRLLFLKENIMVDIYHYCLMTNHFHLLVKVINGEDLSSFMHRLQLSYAIHVRNRYDHVGHVFQERFRSPKIAKESYYLQCGRYIEQNPVKAGLTQNPLDYSWSSAAYYGLGKSDPLITANIYYEAMGKSAVERCIKYQGYLAIEDPYAHLITEAIKVA